MLAATAKRTAQIKVQVAPCLHRRVKIRAAKEGLSITRYVIAALERELDARTERKR
ncbi:MAG: toxin-antitoxin system HicB family antitoxin [Actinomycetota bacterium]|nr:toxin-antitoxin system HicB family antitoxin [Actinomycetota bacterium]